MTPWDPSGKDTTDTTFVLPPSLHVSGRIREPPGLERENTDTAFEQTEHAEPAPDDYSPSVAEDVESLKSLPEEGNGVRLPATERIRSPKRQTEDDLSDEDIQETQRQAIGALTDLTQFTACVSAVTVGDTVIPVETNEDTEEIKQEPGLTEPCLMHVDPEFNEDELKEGMMTEMSFMRGFDVFDENPLEHCSQDDIDNAADCRWVMRRETPHKVRCRLVAHGCFQEDMDTDDTFASTPTLVTLLLLLLSLSFSFCHCPAVGQ